jgi:hypothetical protein
MASQKYLDVLDTYYNLKNQYDTSYKNKRANIVKKHKNDFSKIKKDIKNIKRYCINCKKLGGTLFSNSDGILTAQCTVEDNPCDLDIRISKGSIIDINDFYHQTMDDIEIDKINIISTKLDLLFGLENENITIKLFDDYKTDYKNNLKIIEEIDNFNSEKNSVEIQKKNPKKKGDIEIENIEKKIFLKSKNTELQNLIKKYRDCIYKYKKQQKKSFLRDALLKYNNEILPLINNIRKVKYDEQNIKIFTGDPEKDASIFIINNIKKSIENQEMLVKDFEIISNKK